MTEAGHAVTATFTAAPEAYTGLRKERIDAYTGACTHVWNAPLGSRPFLEALDQGFDVLCHHGAYVTDYKSDDFDYLAAVAANTRNIRQVLAQLIGTGPGRVVLTGSVFEADEGAGNTPPTRLFPLRPVKDPDRLGVPVLV
ncbi:hypothetical protein DVDV_3798 [Desulfovibrio sp. DV]|nr:hypothetical protein DVDV_3798 [Desulfovibrio sp. DV]